MDGSLSPFARRALNVVFVKNDGSCAESTNEKFEVMREHWGPIFEKKPADENEGMKFLKDLGNAKFSVASPQAAVG